MKLITFLSLLLSSICGYSQAKKSMFIFVENGVNRLKPNASYLVSYSDYYKISKENFNMVPFPKNITTTYYKNDTLVSQDHFDSPIEIKPIDFRTLSIGVGRTLSTKKRIRLDHALGFQYSFAEFLVGSLATNYTLKQNTWQDVNNTSRIRFISINNTITGYSKIKSVGFTYQNTAHLRVTKRFDLSFVLNQNLLIKTEDKLMLLQTETFDTTYHYGLPEMESCGGMGIGVMFSDINFYSKQKPPTSNYKAFNGKTGLQYQMTLLTRLSLNLGKKHKTKFYTQIGASPFNFYGNQLKVKSALNYGFGISQDLSF